MSVICINTVAVLASCGVPSLYAATSNSYRVSLSKSKLPWNVTKPVSLSTLKVTLAVTKLLCLYAVKLPGTIL